jgi:hypothetical protein
MELTKKFLLSLVITLIVFVSGSGQSPYQDEPAVDLLTRGCVPKNIGSYKDGLGMCVASSIQGCINSQDINEWKEFREWAARSPLGGGAGPSKVDKYFAQYPNDSGKRSLNWVQVEGPGTLELIEAALASGRAVAATDGGDKQYYRQYVPHMTNICGMKKNEWVMIVDNNRLILEKVPWNEWVKRHESIGRWAVVILERPVLPVPHLRTLNTDDSEMRKALLLGSMLLMNPQAAYSQWGSGGCVTVGNVMTTEVPNQESYHWVYNSDNTTVDLMVNGIKVGYWDFRYNGLFDLNGVQRVCNVPPPVQREGSKMPDKKPLGDGIGQIPTGVDIGELSKNQVRTTAKKNGVETSFESVINDIKHDSIKDAAKPSIVLKGSRWVQAWDRVVASNSEAKRINDHCKIYPINDDATAHADMLGYVPGITFLSPSDNGHAFHACLFTDEKDLKTNNLIKAITKADPNYKPLAVPSNDPLPDSGGMLPAALLGGFVLLVLLMLPKKKPEQPTHESGY